jgi:hypothetical protein
MYRGFLQNFSFARITAEECMFCGQNGAKGDVSAGNRKRTGLI